MAEDNIDALDDGRNRSDTLLTMLLARQIEIASRRRSLSQTVRRLRHPGLSAIEDSVFFDPDWYKARYRDVAQSKIDPAWHYFKHGALEGRRPGPFVENGDRLFHSRNRQRADRAVRPEQVFSPKVLASRRETQLANEIATINPPRRSVVMIDAFYPKPDQDSGSLDQISFIRIFQSLGLHVVFLAEYEFDANSRRRRELEAMGVQCVGEQSASSVGAFLDNAKLDVELFFLSRFNAGGLHYESIRAHSPRSKIIFNTVDLHFVREMRTASITASDTSSRHLDEIKARELFLCAESDAAIVVSSTERDLVATLAPISKVHTVPLIRDYDFSSRNPFYDRRGIAFIGGFDHKPNIDAVHYFLDEIWPRVSSAREDIRFFVVGSNMPDEIMERASSQVDMIGYVEDLSDWLATIRLTVAPLRIGAGAKGKVITSLSNGVPCIASSIAAEGMGLRDGADIAVADDPPGFARTIIELYDDEERWNALSRAGIEKMRTQHSFDSGTAAVKEILQTLDCSTI